ncbi:protein ROOT PRIMORDIUM DEFECTIVE 1 [Hordeum vulgare]|uniref:PORR domain-containing protein n=1 Tax=Hordeum vulgare subsp. vulgare TaxID=112509 RepID=A0A8I7B9K9_HORVV|nr:protein ROOT PRIMORDIUM DEFECTIVE 1 [Hordeum vulgare]
MAPSSLSVLPAPPLTPLHPRRLRHPTAAPAPTTSQPLTHVVRCARAKAASPAPARPLPPPKLVRCPAQDRQAARASRLRFARKLLTLLLSKPRGFLPLRILLQCRRFLGLPRRRPLVPFVLRYPTLFRLFQAPISHPLSPSLSTLAVALTPAAHALAADLAALRGAELAAGLADKVHRLLLMTPRRNLLVSKLAHITPDLGLAMDFRATLCPRHPGIFNFANTSHGHALQLVDPPPPHPSPLPPLFRPAVRPDRLVDRPRRFPHLPLLRGLNLRRAHRDYLLRFHSLPEASPFEPLEEGASAETADRRACAVVREVLAMTMEKRALVDHLTHFRRDFELPNRLRALLVRHPELFYVSIKGVRHSAFLVEDGMLVGRDRLEELVREGKNMRRARKKGVFPVDGGHTDEDDEEDDNVAEGSSAVDGEFGDLFEQDSVAGEDWNEVGDGGGIEGDEEEDPESDAMEEFWVKKAAEEGLLTVAASMMFGEECRDARIFAHGVNEDHGLLERIVLSNLQ